MTEEYIIRMDTEIVKLKLTIVKGKRLIVKLRMDRQMKYDGWKEGGWNI